MLDHIAEFMCDQVGSRYIQESILEHPTSEDCDLIFNEVHPVVMHLSTDVFANFCVQKLFEKASPQQVDMLVVNLRGSILKLSLQTYGCRVIQKVSAYFPPIPLFLKQRLTDRCLITGPRSCLPRQTVHDPQ